MCDIVNKTDTDYQLRRYLKSFYHNWIHYNGQRVFTSYTRALCMDCVAVTPEQRF